MSAYRFAVYGLVAPTAVWAAACGNLTAGGFGEVSVSMSGDDTTASQDPVASVWRAGGGASSDDPEGEIDLEFRIFLVDGEGAREELTTGPAELKVDVQGDQEFDVVRRTVPAASYTSLEVVFTEFEVEIDAGLVIGGVTVTGPVDVELEDGTLVAQRALPLQIEDGDQVDLLVDLNAAVWLQTVDPDLRVVAEAVVEQAIQVVRR